MQSRVYHSKHTQQQSSNGIIEISSSSYRVVESHTGIDGVVAMVMPGVNEVSAIMHIAFLLSVDFVLLSCTG